MEVFVFISSLPVSDFLTLFVNYSIYTLTQPFLSKLLSFN